ncbi:MAG: DUF3179 domain-containing protein [Myxococcales bacterium]|nr:DUF3179 domain-containing protein [Myxococcales bacterium]
MWARTIDGQALKFHLAGIHNQNFLMRDEQTGSFWQQVSGECVAGPLRGERLRRVHSDELTLAQFAAEAPGGTVLQPEAGRDADDYALAWEAQIDRLPTVVDTSDTSLAPRDLIAGVAIGGEARAYLASTLEQERVIFDEVGGTPVLLWSQGGRALRAFDRRVDGEALLLAPAADGALVDAASGSTWDFRGCATARPRAGTCLAPVAVLWDYWFDWRAYNPASTVFGR